MKRLPLQGPSLVYRHDGRTQHGTLTQCMLRHISGLSGGLDHMPLSEKKNHIRYRVIFIAIRFDVIICVS